MDDDFFEISYGKIKKANQRIQFALISLWLSGEILRKAG